MMTHDERTQAWLAAERAAVQAEQDVAAIGQAAADPRVAALFEQAKRLRAEADRLFKELRKHLQDKDPRS
jgi:adenylosuccinate lyase